MENRPIITNGAATGVAGAGVLRVLERDYGVAKILRV